MWHKSRLVLFDVESTGTDERNCLIVGAAVILAGGGLATVTTKWLMAVDIPIEATAIHGITTEHAKQHGRASAEAVNEIRQALLAAWSNGWPVIGHNVVYDLTILSSELKRHELDAIGFEQAARQGPVIDTLVIDKWHDRFRRGSRKLADTAKHYGVNVESSHNAEADALTAGRLAVRMAQQSAVLGKTALGDLHEAQKRWAKEQADSFRAYRLAKGEPVDDIGTGWPIREAYAIQATTNAAALSTDSASRITPDSSKAT